MSHIRVISLILLVLVLQQKNMFGAIPRKYGNTDMVNVSTSILDLYSTKTYRMRKASVMMPSSHCIISS